MPADGIALSVTDMSVAYGKVVAVHDATFVIRTGEAVALTGPNGNGKSSIVMGIVGLAQRRGRVEIFGTAAPAGDVGWTARRGLTLVPERRQLYPNMSAADNILLGCYSWTRSARKARRSAALGYAVELFPELSQHLRQTAGTLSGGQQQMVAIARGLINRPRLLLLDEPSIGLAPKLISDTFYQLRSINKAMGTGFIIVEHNLKTLLPLTDNAIILAQGKIVYDGLSDGKTLDKMLVKIF